MIGAGALFINHSLAFACLCNFQDYNNPLLFVSFYSVPTCFREKKYTDENLIKQII